METGFEKAQNLQPVRDELRMLDEAFLYAMYIRLT